MITKIVTKSDITTNANETKLIKVDENKSFYFSQKKAFPDFLIPQ